MRRLSTRHAQLGQTGLPDVTGGFLTLAVMGVFALAGIVFCAFSVFYRKPLLFLLGLVLASPAFALVGYLLWDEIPRTRLWDFSAERSVAQIDGEPVSGTYYYQGNIRSIIRLPSKREWSGRGRLVSFDARSGQIDAIFWTGRTLSIEQTYAEASRILQELAFENHGLDAWYRKVRGGEPERFDIATPRGTDPAVRVYVQRRPGKEINEKILWTVNVEVVWKEWWRH
ncbi:MAG: hypothetical protein HY322_01845 [Betaproteobacteria bacterium]|nr:hypothetical protein [Betaproteobacteria bacterium]